MLKRNNYPKAYAEVEEILKHLSNEDSNKIDKKFIDMLKKEKDKKYIYKLDETKELEEQEMLRETKTILSYVFIKYLGTKEEKREIKNKFIEDIKKMKK